MILSTTLTAAEPAFRDHQVNGRVILPGVAFAELILLVAEQVDDLHQPVIKDLVLLRPLQLDDADCIVQLEIHPDASGWKVDVSRAAQPDAELLARARLVSGLDHPGDVGVTQEALLGEGMSLTASDEFYARLGRAGLHYGPLYQTVKSVRQRAGRACAQLRAAAAAIEAGHDEGMRLGMLDGALQTIAVLHDDGALWVPFAFGEVRRFAELTPDAVVDVRCAPKGGYDLVISNGDGQVAWTFYGVQLRRLDTGTPLGYYKRVWLPEQTPAPAAPAPARALFVAAASHAAQARQAAACFAAGSDVFVELDPATVSSALAQRLRAEIGAGGTFDLLCYLGADDSAADHAPEQGVMALFRLLRELVRFDLLSPAARFDIWTEDVLACAEPTVLKPQGAALHGLCRSVSREYPRWQVRCVDRSSTDVSPTAGLQALAQAVAARPTRAGFELLAWQRGRFLEERLRRIELPTDPLGGDVFRAGGCYFIVGGAGGIGFALSELLAEERQVRVAWVGRRAPDDEIRRKLAVIGQRGGQAAYFQADVADAASLRGAIAAARAHFGDIHGVIHSALVLKDAALRNLEDDDFLDVVRPKMRGCMALTDAFAGASLDFMLFFSSANSYWGNAAQANYVAASAFEDAWAEHVARLGSTPARVINWGFWGGVGVVASDFYRQQMRAAGIGSIEPHEGLAALRHVLALPADLAPPIVAKLGERFLAATGAGAWQQSRLLPQREPSAFGVALTAGARAGDAGGEIHSTLDQMLGAVSAVERFAEQGILACWTRELDADALSFDKAGLRRAVGVIDTHARLFDACWHMIERAGLLGHRDGVVLQEASVDGATQAWHRWQASQAQLLLQYPQADTYLRLAGICVQALGDVLRGHKLGPLLLFSSETQPLVEKIYKGNVLADFVNDQVADAVCAAVRAQALEEAGVQRRPVRILEIGAGTGGTSAKVLERLSALGCEIEYVYTDVSLAFLQHGRSAFAAAYPFVRFELLDLERDPTTQGFTAGDHDIVIAANVLHTTRSIRDALAHAKRLLRRHGLLIGNEAVSVSAFATVTFGFLPGWWAFTDADDRLPASPLLDWSRWQAVLAATGYAHAALLSVPAMFDDRLPQRAWVAESDGECVEPVVRPAARCAGASEQPPAVVHAWAPPVAAGAAPRSAPGRSDVALQSRLVEIVARVLGVPVADVDPETPYSDFGVDSILAVKLIETVNDDLGIFLQVTDLFNFATVQALAVHIAEQFPAAGAASEPGTFPPAPAPLPAVPLPEPAASPAQQHSPSPAAAARDPAGDDQSIAVIGMAGRFPGAEDLDRFWECVAAGRDCVADVPPHRWDVDAVFDARREARGKTYSKRAGLLDDVFAFDPLFFNLSPREAQVMDPQQRVFLEEAWKALEDGCYTGARLNDVQCGVFVGCGSGDYRDRLDGRDGYEEAFALTGNANSILAARISYLLNLRGPSIAVDTACSSSLVALHQACRSIQAGDCDMALAGGVTILSSPAFHVAASRTGMLSPHGACRTFDRDADGFVPAEAAGVVLLKPLKAAMRDGDRIHGVIRAQAINQDGRSNGITAPSGRAQTALAVQAYERAGIRPDSIGLVEAHGTGTRLGDPIEFDALTQAFRHFTQEEGFCALGSVKANIGHTLAAAGIAGFLKLLLCLRHATLPPLAHFRNLNPHIALPGSPFYIPDAARPWPRRDGMRRAAISAFGFSGTNCHLVVDEAPAMPAAAATAPFGDGLIFISARSPQALRRRAADLHGLLQRDRPASLFDLAFTLEVGRAHFEHRFACVAGSVDQLGQSLSDFAAGGLPACAFTGEVQPRPERLGRAMLEFAATLARDLRASPTQPERADKLGLLAELYCLGFTPVSDPAQAINAGRWTSLPAYPFDKVAYEVPVGLARAADPQQRVAAGATDLGAHTPRQAPSPVHTQSLVFEPVWKPLALAAATAPGRLLIIGDPGEGWLTQMQAGFAAVAIAHAKPDVAFADLGEGRFQLEPRRADDHRALLAALKEVGFVPDRVLWLVDGVESPVDGAAATSRWLMDASVAWLQAWGGRGPLRLLLWSRQATQGCGLALAGARALWRSAAHENPAWVAECLDGDDMPMDVLLACLADVREPGRHRRWSQGQLLELCLAEAGAVEPVPSPWHTSGVCLVSGGPGGLALQMARHVAASVGAKTVLLGRREPTEAERQLIGRSEITYLRCNLADADAVDAAVWDVRQRFGDIRAVIHAAGSLRDGPLLAKEPSDLEAVWGAKVRGAIYLDQATANDPLEHFVVFSSLAAITGNAGQGDYAQANGTLDALMEVRAEQARAGHRKGLSLSISWPYWEGGGMRLDDRTRDVLQHLAGVVPLPVDTGLALLDGLASQASGQRVVAHGDASKLRALLLPVRHADAEPAKALDAPARRQLQEQTEVYLADFLAEQLQVPREVLQVTQELQRYGIDSILIHNFNIALAGFVRDFPRTLLFEMRTIRDVATYLVTHHEAELRARFSGEVPQPPSAPSAPQSLEEVPMPAPIPQAGAAGLAASREPAPGEQPIAIIGMAGRYPDADDIVQFWRNLESGRDSVTEIPAQRWDWREHFDADVERSRDGKIYAKWGAFLDEVDKFDPLFFGISPREAEGMDPQERLFLQTAWATLEDAGYSRSEIEQRSGSEVGVFVGTTSNTYGLLGADAWKSGLPVIPSSLPWSIANRVSYCMNLRGPSLAVDTACSASLTALHLACASLQRGECRMALAGGVNLYLHPSKYYGMCQMRMLSASGRCRPFGEDADGFVPGEGVGAVLLKPLSKAIEDGDFIYGVIRATALNHGGRTNGYTVPDPSAQGELVRRTLHAAGVEAGRISYVEAHGTGTALGDPVELRGLELAHGNAPACAIGSLKANIGHLESAAAIAGLTKLLCQFEHERLVPSLHAEVANPYLDIAKSRFQVQHEAADWPPAPPGSSRMAALSSFGAGGANGHLVVEEHRDDASPPADARQTQVFVLSARSDATLRARAQDLLDYLGDSSLSARRRRHLTAGNIAYTLRVGRDAMDKRLAIVADDVDTLMHRLTDFLDGRAHVDIHQGKAAPTAPAAVLDHAADALRPDDVDEAARRWVAGHPLDWPRQRSGALQRRVPLPAYRFDKRRCWVQLPDPAAGAGRPAGLPAAWDGPGFDSGEIDVGDVMDAPQPAPGGEDHGIECGVI